MGICCSKCSNLAVEKVFDTFSYWYCETCKDEVTAEPIKELVGEGIWTSYDIITSENVNDNDEYYKPFKFSDNIYIDDKGDFRLIPDKIQSLIKNLRKVDLYDQIHEATTKVLKSELQ